MFTITRFFIFKSAASLISTLRYRKSLNRLLKVSYVPATSAVLLASFSSFLLLRPLTVLMKQTRQLVLAVKQSIYLDVYGFQQRLLYLLKLGRFNNVVGLKFHQQPKIGYWNQKYKLALTWENHRYLSKYLSWQSILYKNVCNSSSCLFPTKAYYTCKY